MAVGVDVGDEVIYKLGIWNSEILKRNGLVDSFRLRIMAAAIAYVLEEDPNKNVKLSQAQATAYFKATAEILREDPSDTALEVAIEKLQKILLESSQYTEELS